MGSYNSTLLLRNPHGIQWITDIKFSIDWFDHDGDTTIITNNRIDCWLPLPALCLESQLPGHHFLALLGCHMATSNPHQQRDPFQLSHDKPTTNVAPLISSLSEDLRIMLNQYPISKLTLIACRNSRYLKGVWNCQLEKTLV